MQFVNIFCQNTLKTDYYCQFAKRFVKDDFMERSIILKLSFKKLVKDDLFPC